MSSVFVAGVDRLAGGLVLAFSDGSSGFYSDSLLHSILEKAHSLTGPHDRGLEGHVLFSSRA